MDPSHFFTPLPPLDARLQWLETKKFEILHCAQMVRQNCSQIAQTVKAFNPFLLIVSKKDQACGFLKVFNKSLDSDFLLLCFSSRTKVA
jgi:hypothetical protein